MNQAGSQLAWEPEKKSVAFKEQNLLPYEAENSWTKLRSEDRKIRFGTLLLGVFSLLSSETKILNQISEEPKCFPILP